MKIQTGVKLKDKIKANGKFEGKKKKKVSSEEKIKAIDFTIIDLKAHIKKVEEKLKFFINKQTAEIRVLEKNGKWGGYTGVFYVGSEDEKKIITTKAMKHYVEYFQDVSFYKNRTLGLFVTNPEGKKLIKILQEGENQNEIKI